MMTLSFNVYDRLVSTIAVGEIQSTVHFLLSTVESNRSNVDFGAEAMRLTRTISAIIDGFHFLQGTDDPNNGEGQRIARAIQQRLLPMILDRHSDQQWYGDEERHARRATSTSCSSDHYLCVDRHETMIVVFSPDFVEQHISTILLHLISLLRSRLDSIRDQARDCLFKCMTILGKRYFKFIVEELIAGLQRGYQHLVLLHTIHALLIHISSMATPFNSDPEWMA
jgi:hypothetical protein